MLMRSARRAAARSPGDFVSLPTLLFAAARSAAAPTCCPFAQVYLPFRSSPPFLRHSTCRPQTRQTPTSSRNRALQRPRHTSSIQWYQMVTSFSALPSPPSARSPAPTIRPPPSQFRRHALFRRRRRRIGSLVHHFTNSRPRPPSGPLTAAACRTPHASFACHDSCASADMAEDMQQMRQAPGRSDADAERQAPYRH